MIKKRNMWIQVLLVIVTIGIYCIYWFYATTKEMAEYKKIATEPLLLTILLFIPFACFYSFYKQGLLYENFSNGEMNRWLIFILWIVFSPAVWIIVQSSLNREADKLSVAA